MNRRKFISSVAATGVAVSTLPTMVDSFAVKALAGGDPNLEQLLEQTDRVLVLIQLPGGNDGLNTIVPVNDAIYYNRRPNIAIKKSATLKLTDDLGFHPALSGFRELYDKGMMAVVQGVTYPNPDRSHFRGTDIWLTATDPDIFGSTGWVGRYLSTMAPNYPTVLPEHPLAVQIGTSLSLGLLGNKGPMGISFRDPDEFYRLVNTGGAIEEVPSADGGDTPGGREVLFMRNIARSADVYAKIVKQAADGASSSSVPYPTTDIGAKLKVVSQLISGGLKTRVFLISYTGNNFDTHAGQTSTDDTATGVHANLLRELGDSVSAFMTDMKNKGYDEKIAGMTFSEFGRRVAENGSTGTDHGTAAPLFVFGKDVNGKVFGNNPDLVNLDERGDLLMQHDYRNIYASVLLQWFGTSRSVAQEVLMRDYSATMLPIFKSPVSVHDANKEFSANAFRSITPNPAETLVTIKMNIGAYSNSFITVADMQGRVVRSSSVDSWSGQVVIDVNGLSQGTYVVTLQSDQQVAHTFLQVRR